MASLDLFIVNVAFDDIGREFTSAALADLSWVLTSYAIVYAALLIPLGRLADRYGRKRFFVAGVALFTAASLACALSADVWSLVGFRALQAVGAAALTPASLGLLLPVFAPERRAFAVRIWAAAGALAAAAGPVAGGLLVEASWRWVFLVNVPIGIALIVLAIRVVPDSKDLHIDAMPDFLGSALIAVSIAALALGLVKGSAWGWGAAATLASFTAAALALALFLVRNARHASPVLEPALLKIRTFAWSNVTALAFSVVFAANLLGSVLWLQTVWNFSALQTGLAIAPGPLMVPIFAVGATLFAKRAAPGRMAALGCLLLAGGVAFLALRLGPEPAYVSDFLPGWLLGGIGVGLALPTIMSSATADLPADRAATGSAVINMSRQVGSVIGVSALVAIMGTPLTYAAVHSGFVSVWWVCGIGALISAAAALGMTPRNARRSHALVRFSQPLP